MWSFFSYAFVEGMKMKRQDIVVALLRKETEGERPLSEPVLFQGRTAPQRACPFPV